VADVLIMVGDALGEMIEQGKAVKTSRVDLVRSPIGMSVRAGASKPDIRSLRTEADTMNAKSVAYSIVPAASMWVTELFSASALQTT